MIPSGDGGSDVRSGAARRPWRDAGLITAWWLAVALVGAANQYGFEESWDTTWRYALVTNLGANLSWIPLHLMLHALCRRVPLRGPRWPQALLVHAAACAAVVLLRALSIYVLDRWLHFYEAPPRFGQVMNHSIRHNLFQYWLLAGVSHAAIYAEDAIARSRTAAQLAIELGRAELAALTATLDPHFLFNTLQAIAEVVHTDAAAADRMIVRLGAMLRRLLDDRRPVVPLRDELAFVRDYLAIEEVRFGDRLTVQWDLAPETLDAPVPRLSVQPLVENALHHGLWPARRPGTLAIGAHRRGTDVIVEVRDDGVGPTAPRSAGAGGHGLATVRARIERLYAGQAALEVAANPGAGVAARLRVPHPEREPS